MPIKLDDFTKELIKIDSSPEKQFNGKEIFQKPENKEVVDRKKFINSNSSKHYFKREEEKRSSLLESINKPESFLKSQISEKLAKNEIELNKKEIYEISDISFSCMSFEDQKNIKVVDILQASIIPGLNNSLFDIRMGTLDSSQICHTCQEPINNCSGHFGLINLNKKFPNPNFKEALKITLKCICHYCGHPYIREPYLKALGIDKLVGIKRLKEIAKITPELFKLHNCPSKIPDYTKDYINDYILAYKVKDTNGVMHTIEKSLDNVEDLLSVLTKEDLKLLGYEGDSNPVNFIMKGILVCPPCTRPTMYADGIPKENYITDIYYQIISNNNKLKNFTITGDSNRINIENILYENIISLFFGNDKKNSNEKNGSLFFILGGKEGLLRKNILGKRVNFSARTVAGPASEANFGEILTPRFFAKTLTVPEKITIYNIDRLRNDFANGNAQSINRGNNQIITINDEMREKYLPIIGDIIIRYIQDGDSVMVGRQPTLHAESFMGFNVKLHDKLTIGLHSCVNAPFNADFDGDELNLHVIQEIKAQVETNTIANCKYHIMNSQSNKPMMGLAYNALLSSYLMTMVWIRDDIQKIEITTEEWDILKESYPTIEQSITKKQWAEIISSECDEVEISEERFEQAISVVNDSNKKETLYDRCIENNINPRSGRALFSLNFPINLNLTIRKSSSRTIVIGDREMNIKINENIVIKDGILIFGTLDKSSVGTSSNSLVQLLTKIYSFKEACRFLNDGQKICDWFLMWHGYSIGYKAIDMDRKNIVKLIKEKTNETQFEIYKLGPIPTEFIPNFFWKKTATTFLSNTEQIGRKIGEQILSLNNPLNVMGEPGSKQKGTKANTAQIVGSLGEQFCGGDLPKLEFNDAKRYLPTFLVDDVSIGSLGYVVNSFLDGLTPSEEMSHLAASREGLIDTAQNTALIGYISRRFRKVFEDIYINPLGQVVNVDDKIFSFTFGDCLNTAMQMPSQTKENGKKFGFCDVNMLADMVNREYEMEF